MEEANIQYLILTCIVVVILVFSVLLIILLLSQKAIRNKQKQTLYAVMESQISEQMRIGQDLHDQIFPDIASVITSLELVHTKGDNKLDLRQSIEPLRNLGEDVRRIAHNLTQQSLVKKGLTLAIDDFCAASEDNSYSITLTQQHNLEEFPSVLQYQILQIIKELITNAKKHSKGSEIHVTLVKVNSGYKLKVNDNGVGFKTNNSVGIGFQNIKNRVAMLNGALSIDNNVTSGTSVIITFPNLKE